MAAPYPPAIGQPPYTKYRARPRFLDRFGSGDALAKLRRSEPDAPRAGRPWTWGRVARWALAAVGGWLLLSLLLFLLSAQIESGKIGGEVDRFLAGGFPLTQKSTILVLGSDARTEGLAEPGSQVGGPSRSDSILLVRTGAGAGARLSIPRDTIVDIPGHGANKINAAYALGGTALAVQTVRDFLGIDINHVVEVDFANFPDLIDAMGGIDVTTGRVCSDINGGRRNGGQTLRLKKGEHHLDGDQALALARTRVNKCNASEDDLTRARRQQEILGAIKDRAISPWTFVRLPWVSWNAPKAIRSDMSGPSLIGLIAAMTIGGDGNAMILRPDGTDGGTGLTISETKKRRIVRRFLEG